jgi:xanthine dehydrogenase accessory factor
MFVRREPPVPRLIIMGGSHIGEALSRLMRTMGWRSMVIDPREAFSQSWRFSHADRLLHEWPQEAFDELEVGEGDAVAAVTHNEQMDDEAVAQALGRKCYYVGVLGGRGTQRNRRARLKERGFTEEEIGRIHGPIGLDIGAAVPEEIALSVAAEVVAAYRRLPHTEDRA